MEANNWAKEKLEKIAKKRVRCNEIKKKKLLVLIANSSQTASVPNNICLCRKSTPSSTSHLFLGFVYRLVVQATRKEKKKKTTPLFSLGV